jgi:hypothetical protein
VRSSACCRTHAMQHAHSVLVDTHTRHVGVHEYAGTRVTACLVCVTTNTQAHVSHDPHICGHGACGWTSSLFPGKHRRRPSRIRVCVFVKDTRIRVPCGPLTNTPRTYSPFLTRHTPGASYLRPPPCISRILTRPLLSHSPHLARRQVQGYLDLDEEPAARPQSTQRVIGIQTCTVQYTMSVRVRHSAPLKTRNTPTSAGIRAVPQLDATPDAS